MFHDKLHLIGAIIFGIATLSFFIQNLLQSLQKLFVNKDITRCKSKTSKQRPK